ncbi:MAG: 3-carboxy-cis,cis-muconate cycloisomerase [Noviherbaspirillum sp.]
MTFPNLTACMFSTEEMQNLFSDQACVQRMLDFEAALAVAEARQGVIPAAAAPAIARHCDAAGIDMAQLARAAGAAGNLAIPLVKQLTARVAEADADAAKYVHWGATSQDAIDTGLVLQLRDALAAIDTGVAALAAALAALAQEHGGTVMAGRTWMQHALPTTFGLKAAGWLDALLRHQDRLAELRRRVLVLQFGGAAGTLASLGGKGLAVAADLAGELKLDLPAMPWHAHQDRLAEVAGVLGLLVGTLGKMARDISLLMQTEVAEASEPAAPGRGGSSTMPHKRNPVGCAAVLAAAVRVPGLVATMLSGMVQEHERALGGWQAEWESLPEIVRLAGGALQQMEQVAAGLTVDARRMRANLDATRGQIMAEAVSLELGRGIGRMAAHEVVERAARRAAESGRRLEEALAEEDAVRSGLPDGALERLLDPAGYTGQAAAFTGQVLRAYRDRMGRGALVADAIHAPLAHAAAALSAAPGAASAGAMPAGSGTPPRLHETERYDNGMTVRRAVLGSAHVDRAQAKRTALTAEFQDLITRYAWGEIWTRPGLPRHTRSLLTIMAMIATNREEELKLHLRAAANNGVTREEIKEVLMQAAIYCGVPAANSAFHMAQEIFNAQDQAQGQ